MVDESKYEMSFEIISTAGNAKSLSLMAIESAREFDFNAAEEQLKEAEIDLKKAHHLQTELIQKEARGEVIDVDIILVHSQDHLTMAIMAGDFAREFIEIYKTFKKIAEKMEVKT